MKLLRRHWYNIGAVVAFATLSYAAIKWRQMNVSSLLLLLNFVALLLHQFEEYGWPGGEPAILNMVLQTSDRPDRYPLNQNSAMVLNVLAAYGFYLIPVFFPNVYWLGIAPTLFGFGQFIVHGIVTPRELGSFYNPGLGAVVFLHIPIGVAYLLHISALRTVKPTDWIVAIAYVIVFILVTLKKMTYTWLAAKDSRYPIAIEEMQRFNVRARLSRHSHSRTT